MALRYGAAIRTRTSVSDYTWVGDLHGHGSGTGSGSGSDEPGRVEVEDWWRSGWGNPLLHEGACLLRRVSGSDVRWLLTGIESGRRDSSSSHTRISYDLLFESDSDPDSDSGLTAAQVIAIVRTWWSQRGTDEGSEWELGTQLDSALAQRAEVLGCSVDELLTDRAYSVLAAEIIRVTDIARNAGGEPAASKAEPDDFVSRDWAWVGADAPEADGFLLHGGSMVYCRELTRDHLPETPTALNMQETLKVDHDVVVVADDDDEVHHYPKAAPPVPGVPDMDTVQAEVPGARGVSLALGLSAMTVLILVLMTVLAITR